MPKPRNRRLVTLYEWTYCEHPPGDKVDCYIITQGSELPPVVKGFFDDSHGSWFFYPQDGTNESTSIPYPLDFDKAVAYKEI